MIFDRKISKEIISFSLYNLLGNMGTVVNTQGTAFVINRFFGLIFNAASTVATTVSSVITSFSSNVMTAFRPQITKSYASGDIVSCQSLLNLALKAILLFYSLIAIPVGICIKELLSLWLVDVPYFADIFCQLMLINIFFETARYIINIGIHATGNVRLSSFLSGFSFLLNPFIVYICFYVGLSCAFAYISVIAINLLLTIANILILKHNDNRIVISQLFDSFFRTTSIVVVIMVFALHLYQNLFYNNFLNVFIICSVTTILLLLLCVYVVLTREQRVKLRNIIKTKLVSR